MPEINLPKFGMSAIELEILEVLVKVGDRVEPGQRVIEAASDKVDVEIDSEIGGTVTEIRVEPGGVYAMGFAAIVLE